MKFGTWNVMSLYRAGYLILLNSEIDKKRMDLIVQEVNLEGNGTLESENYILFCGEGNANHQLETGFIVHRQIRSPVKKVEFINGLVSCITLRPNGVILLL